MQHLYYYLISDNLRLYCNENNLEYVIEKGKKLNDVYARHK